MSLSIASSTRNPTKEKTISSILKQFPFIIAGTKRTTSKTEAKNYPRGNSKQKYSSELSVNKSPCQRSTNNRIANSNRDQEFVKPIRFFFIAKDDHAIPNIYIYIHFCSPTRITALQLSHSCHPQSYSIVFSERYSTNV